MTQKLKGKTGKNAAAKTVKKEPSGAENRLISIRIPENVIEELRKVAGQKGMWAISS